MAAARKPKKKPARKGNPVQKKNKPKLTANQESFCQAIADGHNQSSAYRIAYRTENYSDKAIWVNACKLAATAKVKLRIQELREELQKEQIWSRGQAAKVLLEIITGSWVTVPGYVNVKTGEEVPNRDILQKNSPKEVIMAVRELNAMYGFDKPEGPADTETLADSIARLVDRLPV